MLLSQIKGLKSLPGPVLITGHTGFKGTWLTLLLEQMNFSVAGISLPTTHDSLYTRLGRNGAIQESLFDIRDLSKVKNFFSAVKPSAVLHLAAQPLVIESYKFPVETFDVNVIGTANVLMAAMECDSVKTIGIVTTDKVYKNNELGRKFQESDPLQGIDPYSASKVGTEATASAWRNISRINSGPAIISLRAGNVIGGGDCSENRIVPDLIRALIGGTECEVRNPKSTRPWQHVLDPLSGYLLALDKSLSVGMNQEAYNFGPLENSLTVAELIEIAQNYLSPKKIKIKVKPDSEYPESNFLDLDSQLAQTKLSWRPHLNQKQAIESTFNWWQQVNELKLTVNEACDFDIRNFLNSN